MRRLEDEGRIVFYEIESMRWGFAVFARPVDPEIAPLKEKIKGEVVGIGAKDGKLLVKSGGGSVSAHSALALDRRNWFIARRMLVPVSLRESLDLNTADLRADQERVRMYLELIYRRGLILTGLAHSKTP